MTRNLNSTVGNGLGHFLVILQAGNPGGELAERLRRLRPEITDAKIPPLVQSIGAHATIAAWGGASVHNGQRGVVVGNFQPARTDTPGISAQRLAERYSRNEMAGLDERQLAGANLSAIVVDSEKPVAIALVSPFRQLPLYRTTFDGLTAFASDARLFTELGIVPRDVDPEALYHYLNYSCIPAPHSIFRRVRKVPAGTRVTATPGNIVEEVYWRPRFEGDRDGSPDALAEEMRSQLFETVRAYRPGQGGAWGTFLSGGTDSSSITGILATEKGHAPVQTYSIGFGEDGYDELAFARIAAEHFGAEHHHRQVDEQDTLAAIPKLLQAFDEPYGNASVVPTYYCAAMAAADGRNLLLAGDGGDENFGGNERYARDAIYRAYENVPRSLRRGLAAMLGGNSLTGSLLENRVRHFARRGALANPERFYREDSFASECYDGLLTPDMRAAVPRNRSLDVMQEHYNACPNADKLHRLMYVDLMMAIADNDLVKVQRASHAAGISVAYPYLDPDVVNFAGRLHARWKVKGLKKRYLFKQALRDLLPEKILNKPKQGFGLPIAYWTRQQGPLRELVQDTLRSNRARERGYFDNRFVDELMQRHDRGGWDFSGELWRLLMLELWQREYLDVA